MKHFLVIISGILLVVPQVYTYAGDMEDMNHGQSGGQYMQNGQHHDGMNEEEKMRYQQGQQQPNGKMIQPTGGSKMLPPFGNQGSGPQGNMGNGGNSQWSGSGAEAKMAQELKNRRNIVAELAKLGVDTSVFTEEVINNPQEFWKLAESYRNIKQQSYSGKNMPNPQMKDKERSDDSSREKMSEGINSTSEKKVTPARPALTEKARKLLQEKLDKIPAEKRDTLLPKMLKSAQAQLEAAQKKGNKVNIRKLEAIVEIIQDEIESEDDEGLIDSLFTE